MLLYIILRYQAFLLSLFCLLLILFIAGSRHPPEQALSWNKNSAKSPQTLQHCPGRSPDLQGSPDFSLEEEKETGRNLTLFLSF